MTYDGGPPVRRARGRGGVSVVVLVVAVAVAGLVGVGVAGAWWALRDDGAGGVLAAVAVSAAPSSVAVGPKAAEDPGGQRACDRLRGAVPTTDGVAMRATAEAGAGSTNVTLRQAAIVLLDYARLVYAGDTSTSTRLKMSNAALELARVCSQLGYYGP